MAARLKLTQATLPFIWNISARVGPSDNCPNRPTDVELMKVLLAMGLPHPQIRRFGIAKGNSPPPPRDYLFDPILGFWIFRLQQLGKNSVVDGFASPAQGTSFAPGTPWVIYWFNHFAKEVDADLWKKLPENKFISAQLRTELLK